MSVLSVKSQISVKHKKSGIIGNLKWDGLDPFTLMVENVSRTTKVAVGDTFITTGFSNFFPPDIPVAVVKKVDQDPSTSFHFIDVKLTNRLDKIDYVYIVKNEDKPQIDSLLLNAIPAP
jgi:rod shape-determining protein MreC